jgi:hypothetical protein
VDSTTRWLVATCFFPREKFRRAPADEKVCVPIFSKYFRALLRYVGASTQKNLRVYAKKVSGTTNTNLMPIELASLRCVLQKQMSDIFHASPRLRSAAPPAIHLHHSNASSVAR